MRGIALVFDHDIVHRFLKRREVDTGTDFLRCVAVVVDVVMVHIHAQEHRIRCACKRVFASCRKGVIAVVVVTDNLYRYTGYQGMVKSKV